MSDGIHRDDLDYTEAEAIVRALQAEHPGAKVVFAGDAINDLPEEVQQQIQQATESLSEQVAEAWAKGLCFDCDARIPGDWPPSDGKVPDGWLIWGSIGDDPDGPMVLQCPACAEAEETDEASEPAP